MTRSPNAIDDAYAQAAAFIEARRLRHLGFRMDATDDAGTDQTGSDDKTGTDDDKGSNEPEKTPEQLLAEALAAVEEWKGHSRKHETTSKANKAAAEELARIKAANATPDEKLTAAQREAAEARAELARYRVAAETGIPADLISGDDEDAMRAHADRLKAFRGEQKKNPPKPDPTQGGSGGDKTVSASDVGKAEAARRFGKKN